MAYKNIVTITDQNGYREEIWDYADYDKMQDTLDEQVAEGEIFGWWISN